MRRLIAVLALQLSTGTAAAQVQLHGRVIEDLSGQPIPSVTVELRDARGARLAQRVTDGSGQFLFQVRGAGPVSLVAESIGYQRTLTPPLELAGYSLFRVELRLDPEAVVLAPLEIVARYRSASPTLSRYQDRLRAGIGQFVTREEIERRKPGRVTDLLEMIPGLAVQPAGPGRFRTVFMARSAHCPAQIYIDGFHINRPISPRGGRGAPDFFALDATVQPAAIEGIEIYTGLSKVPDEFLTPEATCGVVAVWTRRGG